MLEDIEECGFCDSDGVKEKGKEIVGSKSQFKDEAVGEG
jgi:hypothetical protein